MRTWRMNFLTKFLFKYKAGWFTMRGQRYHVDPDRYEKKAYRPWWTFQLPIMERIELCLGYQEGEAEPVYMFAERDEKGTDARSVEAITEAAFLRALLPPPIPWLFIFITLGLFVFLGIIGVAFR